MDMICNDGHKTSGHFTTHVDESPRQFSSLSGLSEEDSPVPGKKTKGIDLKDPFWDKLKLVAETKVGAAEAEKFCWALQEVHQKLVYKELSSDAAWKFLNSSRC
ncbi:hypothetical protein ACFE04_005478 [Oxalis oulophora]